MAKAERVRTSIKELIGGDEAFAADLRTAEDVLEAARLVRGMRQSAGLTQQQLAGRLRVSQPRISAMEKGDGQEGPTYAMLKRVARACGVEWRIEDMLRRRSSGTTAPSRVAAGG